MSSPSYINTPVVNPLDPGRFGSTPPMSGNADTDRENGRVSTHAIDQLNSFLRGEISATETYRIALEKVTDAATPTHAGFATALRGIQEEHSRAAQALRERISALGGTPADSSGVWGSWAKLTTRVGALFGDATSIKALKEGEEHGLKDYQADMLAIDGESRALIANQLIPAQKRHIDRIDQILAAI